MNELTQRGITALRSGDRSAARELLTEAVRLDPEDANAWLWLTGALDNDEERIDCLNHVLRIDPSSQPAARGLSQLLARQKKNVDTSPPEPAAVMVTHLDNQAALKTETEEIMETAPTAEVVVDQTEQAVPDAEDIETVLYNEFHEPAPALDTSQGFADRVEPLPAPKQRKRSKPSSEPLQTIFRSRPSHVPALLGFWFFFFGTVAVWLILRETSLVNPVFAIGLGLVLMAVVVYAIIRNFSVRYELTNHYISLPYRGRRVHVHLREIALADCRQTTFQRLIGTGDIRLKSTFNNELINMRMRNIPDCQRKIAQIHAAITAAGGIDSRP